MNLHLLLVAKCVRKSIFTVKVIEQQLEEVAQRCCEACILTDIQNSAGHCPEQTTLAVGLNQMICGGPWQHRPFCNSVILYFQGPKEGLREDKK